MEKQTPKLILGISIYLLAKQILNVLIGAGFGSLLIPVLIVVFLYLRLWKYTHYAAAGVIALIALRYLPDNLRSLPGSALYLTEGILDFGVAVMLVKAQEIKEYFDQS